MRHRGGAGAQSRRGERRDAFRAWTTGLVQPAVPRLVPLAAGSISPTAASSSRLIRATPPLRRQQFTPFPKRQCAATKSVQRSETTTVLSEHARRRASAYGANLKRHLASGRGRGTQPKSDRRATAGLRFAAGAPLARNAQGARLRRNRPLADKAEAGRRWRWKAVAQKAVAQPGNG